MSVVAALILGAGMVMITIAPRSLRLGDRVGRYLWPDRSTLITEDDQSERRSAAAGLRWSNGELLVRRAAAAAGGAIVGVLLAQGDLFVEGPGGAMLPLAALVPPRDGSSSACGSQRNASGGRGVCASSVRS